MTPLPPKEKVREKAREKGKTERMIDSFDTRVQKVPDSLSIPNSLEGLYPIFH